MKIVLNKSYNGVFSVSQEFCDYYGIKHSLYYVDGIIPMVKISEYLGRDDKRLIEYIERFGSEKASGYRAELKIVEMPPRTRCYRIYNYGEGYETIYGRNDFDEEFTR